MGKKSQKEESKYYKKENKVKRKRVKVKGKVSEENVVAIILRNVVKQ